MISQYLDGDQRTFLDTLVPAEEWINRAEGGAMRALRWTRFVEAASEANDSGKLYGSLGASPMVGFDFRARQALFAFTNADGGLVVVSENGIPGLGST